MKIIKFLARFTPYQPGEVAGFPDDVAQAHVDAKRAQFVDAKAAKAEGEGASAGKTVKPAATGKAPKASKATGSAEGAGTPPGGDATQGDGTGEGGGEGADGTGSGGEQGGGESGGDGTGESGA